MTKKEIAIQYIALLEKGVIEQIIALFSPEGIVQSPLYGSLKASSFYPKLNDDTKSSQLKLRGIFEDVTTGNLAIYFTYTWILKNNKKVVFDVVDIVEFDAQNKIKKLKIIYDTVVSRDFVKQLSP